MRLLARVYADGNTPSKVSVPILSLPIEISIDDMTVVAELYEAQVHGQISVVVCYRYHQAATFCKSLISNVLSSQSGILTCAKLAS